MTQLETAARREILNDSTMRGYVNDKVFKFNLLEDVQGTGGRAVVVRRNGGWSQALQVNTQEFPVLAVDLWADCSRDSEGNKVREDALENAYSMYQPVNALFHGKRGGQWWGRFGSERGLLVVSSVRFKEPMHQDKLQTHGNVTTQGVVLIDQAVVTVEYAVCCVH